MARAPSTRVEIQKPPISQSSRPVRNNNDQHYLRPLARALLSCSYGVRLQIIHHIPIDKPCGEASIVSEDGVGVGGKREMKNMLES